MNVCSFKTHPYYYPNQDLPHGGEGFLCFDIEDCERCGRRVRAPNAFTICEGEEFLISLGIKRKKPPSDELEYCEALDKLVCSGCWM